MRSGGARLDTAAGLASAAPFDLFAVGVAVVTLSDHYDRWERIFGGISLFLPIVQQLWAAPLATLLLLVNPRALPGLAVNVASTGLACVITLVLLEELR